MVRKFDVGELLIPVILELVDPYRQHLGHRVIHTLYPTIAIWLVGAGPQEARYAARASPRGECTGS